MRVARKIADQRWSKSHHPNISQLLMLGVEHTGLAVRDGLAVRHFDLQHSECLFHAA
jgi:hypothetical protein